MPRPTEISRRITLGHRERLGWSGQKKALGIAVRNDRPTDGTQGCLPA